MYKQQMEDNCGREILEVCDEIPVGGVFVDVDRITTICTKMHSRITDAGETVQNP